MLLPHYTHATAADLAELAASLRPADAEESRIASGGMSALEAVRFSAAVSDACLAVRHNGALFAVIGASPLSVLHGTCVLWALGTHEVDRRPRPFIRHSRAALAMLADAHPWADTFTNSFMSSNTRTREWLAWLGASFGTPFLLPDPSRPSSFSPHPFPAHSFTPFSIQRSDLHV